MLINVVKHAVAQSRIEPDDDDIHNDDEVDDDVVDDGGDDDDLSFAQPAAKVAFLLFCSASHSSKPLYHKCNHDHDDFRHEHSDKEDDQWSSSLSVSMVIDHAEFYNEKAFIM